MIKKNKLKGCCGSLVYLLETENTISKLHIEPFKKAGYSVPNMYAKANMLFVEKKGIIAHGTFGSKRMQVKVNSPDNNTLLDQFCILLDSIVNKAVE